MNNPIIRSIYFYAVSIVALFMLVFSLSDLVNLGMKQWVFTSAGDIYPCIPRSAIVKPEMGVYAGPTQEECDQQNEQSKKNEIRNRQNSAVRDLSMLVVALPLFLFHFRIVQKEWKERKAA